VVSSSKKPARKLPALLSSTSVRPKRSTAAAAAFSALWGVGHVKGRDEQVLVLAKGRVHAAGLRPVAATLWPAAMAARANSTPIPRPAPVISQVFVLAFTLDPRLACKAVL